MIVLGAGFSVVAGHPVMADFATVVTTLATDPHTPLREDERERFRRVLEYRSSLQRLYGFLYLDLDNVEHLFGLLDMESSLSPGVSGALPREDLIFVLVKTLELTYRIAPELNEKLAQYKRGGSLQAIREIRRTESRHPSRSYYEFVQALRPHDIILTFNYDTVLEDALLAAGIGPHYVTGEPAWSGISRTQSVLKLHGSVNFIESKNGDVSVVDFELLEKTTDRYYEQGQPLLVPPTWNKTSPSPLIQQIWTEASRALERASRLVFIGYSLPETDLFFRYLLANALVHNEILQAVSVLDPAQQTRERYASFVSEALRNQGKFQAIDNVFQNAWREGLGV